MVLLLIPAFGVMRLISILGWGKVCLYGAGISLVTLLQYLHDKRQAENGGWRTPESTLHFLELAGGWPVAFLAQRLVHHKIAKSSYQATFWIIVIVHQYGWYDFNQNWRWSRPVLEMILR